MKILTCILALDYLIATVEYKISAIYYVYYYLHLHII